MITLVNICGLWKEMKVMYADLKGDGMDEVEGEEKEEEEEEEKEEEDEEKEEEE
jgi:choline-glycine betaine transporter